MRNSKGFTLVEIMIAIAISTIVMLTVREILEQLANSADDTTDLAITADRRENTERAVRLLFSRAEPSDSARPFTGNAEAVKFTSWCDVPSGWLEQCNVTANVDSLGLKVQTSQSDTFTVSGGKNKRELRYLITAANGGQWTNRWNEGLSTPLAVGIVSSSDTTVLRIGERR